MDCETVLSTRLTKSEPLPISYCSIQHGRLLFPELAPQLVGLTQWQAYAIVRKYACRTFGTAGIPCDPNECRARFALAAKGGAPFLVQACKDLWKEKYGFYEEPEEIDDRLNTLDI